MQSPAHRFRAAKLACYVLSFVLIVPFVSAQEIYWVRPGETVSGILWSRIVNQGLRGKVRLYGARGALRSVLAMNPQIENPDKMFPGTQLVLPDILRAQRQPASTSEPETRRQQPEVGLPLQAAPPETPYAFGDRFRIEIGGGANLASNQFGLSSFSNNGAVKLSWTGTEFPNAFFEAQGMIGEKAEIFGSFDGRKTKYTTAMGVREESLEARGTLGAGLRLNRRLMLGFGFETHQFSYLTPVLSNASSFRLNSSRASLLNAVFRYRYEAVSRAETEVLGIARYPLGLDASAGDSLNVDREFAGFSITAKLRYLITPVFFVGPYFRYDFTSIKWHQTGAFNGAQQVEFSDFGGGLHFGAAF